jgi:hypothetical protein
MTFKSNALIGLVLAMAGTVCSAQFVKGNEAVRRLPDGSTKVDTPPLPSVALGKACPAEQAGCAGGGWMMVETQDGLRECTEIYARPGTCRQSTYGKQKYSRLWIVKARAAWMQCQFPDLGGNCVSTKALPISAVQ